MLAKVLSGATIGLESIPVEVEVDISEKSLPAFNIVGLPGKAVEEAKERVRAALKNSGADFPRHRITVNLTPADLPKEGPSYDLPIALGIMKAQGQIKAQLTDCLILGELSLDGSLRHTNGILPITLLAKQLGLNKIFLPLINAREAAVIKKVKVYPTASLAQLFHHFQGLKEIKAHRTINFDSLRNETAYEFDISEIIGQEQSKRALEIAAAGGHNILMIGPPGAGKTMLARTLPSILPRLREDEALEVTKIYSVTGNLPPGESIIKDRPFRSPHHTISRIGLIGGGTKPAPGEISLAHRGVLFLDEFPEFPRSVLEALRQPLEDGFVQISRAAGSVTLPSKFLLVAASNPCPCGNLGSKKKLCSCLSGQVLRYQKRVSGPILDRIDMHLSVPEVKTEKLVELKSSAPKIEKSRQVRFRVQQARDRQTKRFQKTKLTCNAEMGTKEVKKYCPLDSDSLRMMQVATEKMNLSARSYFRIIKVAQTITDLALEDRIKSNYIAEALQYRRAGNDN